MQMFLALLLEGDFLPLLKANNIFEAQNNLIIKIMIASRPFDMASVDVVPDTAEYLQNVAVLQHLSCSALLVDLV